MRRIWIGLAFLLGVMLAVRIFGPMGVRPAPAEKILWERMGDDSEGKRAQVSARGEISLSGDERSEVRSGQEDERIKEGKKRERAIAFQKRKNALRSGAIFPLRSRGRVQQLELAMDEVWLDKHGGQARLVAVERQPDASSVGRLAENLAKVEGADGRLVLYPAGQERSQWNRHVLTGKLWLEWDEQLGTRAQLTSLGLIGLEELPGLSGRWLARVDGGMDAALNVAERVEALSGVRTAELLLATQKQIKQVPNDPLFPIQWHLRNTGQNSGLRGMDALVVPVWERFKGMGMKIGVIDDGVQLNHPDLQPNRAPEGHFDWNDNDDDPSPVAGDDDSHGTAVAGVSAARSDNDLGVAGVAPLAQIVGLRLIAKPSTDADEAAAMLHLNDLILVKNNSWGTPDDGMTLGYAGPLFTSAVATATRTGRGGKGSLLIWAGGNGGNVYDNANKDGYANNRHVLAVGAVTNRGGLAPYSEDGACLVVSAPSSGGSAEVITTDLSGNQGYNRAGVRGELADRDYTNRFGGTSSATPVVSGVAALMLEANPNLGWRDVKEIFLRSPRQLNPGASDWVARTGGRHDLDKIKHHHGFGGGLVNAQAAVEMAETWENLGTAIAIEETSNQKLTIPDGGAEVELAFDFTSRQPIRVEDVEVEVNIVHPFRGDLKMMLTSPSGVVSRLVEATPIDYGENYENWTFSSVRHWGEASLGVWKLTIQDRIRGDTGRVTIAKVRLHGVSAPPVELLAISGGGMIAEGQPARFTADATGFPQILYEWTRDGAAAGSTTDGDFQVEPSLLKDAGLYTVKASNVTGTMTAAMSVPLWVVQVTDKDWIVNEGKSLRFSARASGPGLSYRWYRDNVPLDEGSGRTGVFTPNLTLHAATEGDEAVYSCQVSAGDRSLVAGMQNVRVRLRPVITPQLLKNGIVSGHQVIAFEAESETTRFFGKGFPPGLKLNSRTGELSGRPTRAGDYEMEIWAINAAGRGLARRFNLSIESFPELAVGSYDGLLVHSESGNEGLGGRAQWKISNRGGVSGIIQNGRTRHVFRGMIDAVPGGGDPEGRLELKRRNFVVAGCEFVVDLDDEELQGKVVVGDQETTFTASKAMVFKRDDPATDAAGQYTTSMNLISDVDDPATVPQGLGFSSHLIDTRGRVRSIGRLGDGSLFTSAGTLDRKQSWTMFQLVSRQSGAVSGVLKVNSDSTSNFIQNSIEGMLAWRRLNGVRRDYPAGLGLLNYEVVGAKYFRPLGDTWVMRLDDPATLPNGVNAIGELFEGGISDAAMGDELNEVPFAVSSAGNAVVVGENPASISVQIQPRTGVASIRLRLVDDDPLQPGKKRIRRIKGVGLVVNDEVVGSFQLGQIPVPGGGWSRTAILSGGWRLKNASLNAG